MEPSAINMDLTPSEIQLAARIGFDEAVLRLVKNALGKEIEPYGTFIDPWGRNRSELVIRTGDEWLVQAFTVQLADRYDSTWHLDEISDLRSVLPPDYRLFLIEDGKYRPNVTVLKTADPYEIIRLRETVGWDFECQCYESEELIRVLVEWQQECRLYVIGADYNNIKLILETLPDDLVAFAEKVNFLCWELDEINNFGQYDRDAAENRIIAEKLAAHLQETRRLYLWWD